MPQIIYDPEFISDFESVGSYGYELLYDYNEKLNRISISRIKHQKEGGFV